MEKGACKQNDGNTNEKLDKKREQGISMIFEYGKGRELDKRGVKWWDGAKRQQLDSKLFRNKDTYLCVTRLLRALCGADICWLSGTSYPPGTKLVPQCIIVRRLSYLVLPGTLTFANHWTSSYIVQGLWSRHSIKALALSSHTHDLSRPLAQPLACFPLHGRMLHILRCSQMCVDLSNRPVITNKRTTKPLLPGKICHGQEDTHIAAGSTEALDRKLPQLRPPL